MAKVYEKIINYCYQCSACGVTEDGIYICLRENEYLTTNQVYDGFPEWCPLEDIEE